MLIRDCCVVAGTFLLSALLYLLAFGDLGAEPPAFGPPLVAASLPYAG